MLDEPKHDRVSLEPAKRERKRSQGRHKLKSAASGANGSDHQSDASSNENSPSKPESLPTGLPEKIKEAAASAKTFVVEVDASTNSVVLNSNLRIFGTNNEDSNLALAKQVIGLVPATAGKLDSQNVKWALNTIYGLGPKDELEGLLAVQMIGVHSLAIECLERASREGQTPYGMDANINRATKLLRTFTTQMEALNRHRGKVGQQMVVGNVNVNEGGQAIVGPVSHDSRERLPRKMTQTKSNEETTPARRGWLKNGNPPGDPNTAPRCGAKTRRGTACKAPAMRNGRCRMHGGASTGPRTPEGLAKSRRSRWKHGLYSSEGRAEQERVRELIRQSRELLKRL